MMPPMKVDENDDSMKMYVCNYEEDEKNQKILVGYGSLAAETSMLTPIPRNRDSLLKCAIVGCAFG